MVKVAKINPDLYKWINFVFLRCSFLLSPYGRFFLLAPTIFFNKKRTQWRSAPSILTSKRRRLCPRRLCPLRLSRGLCDLKTRLRPITRPARARCRLFKKAPRKNSLFCFFFLSSHHFRFQSPDMVLSARPRQPTNSRISPQDAASAPMGLKFPASSRGSSGSRRFRSRRQRPSRSPPRRHFIRRRIHTTCANQTFRLRLRFGISTMVSIPTPRAPRTGTRRTASRPNAIISSR